MPVDNNNNGTLATKYDGILSFVEDFQGRIPPKQTAFVQYFQRLKEMIASGECLPSRIAASFWLALIRPDLIEGVSESTWKFRIDATILSILQRLVSNGLLAIGDTIEVAQRNQDGQSSKIESLDIIFETLMILGRSLKAIETAPATQLKLIQLILTIAATGKPIIGGRQLVMILERLAEIARYSAEPVNQNAAKAAITQIINELFDGDLNDKQEAIAQWLFQTIRDPKCSAKFCCFILDIIRDVIVRQGRTIEETATTATTVSSLTSSINRYFLPSILRFINIKNPEIYDRLLVIVELILRKHPASLKEFLEVVLSDFFSVKVAKPTAAGLATRLEFAPNLINGLNRFKTIDFLKRVLFSEGEMLLAVFCNCDCEAEMDPVCLQAIALCLALLQVTYKSAHDRNYNLAEIALKCRIADSLLEIPTVLAVWLREGCSTYGDDVQRFLEASATRKKIENIVEEFNGNAQHGIEMAISDGIIQNNSSSIATFLRFTRDLDKTVIGEYLGASENKELRQAYLNTFDFQDMSFVECLRTFLEAFKLPGESQIVERYMEGFAQRLNQCNPQRFFNVDVFFQLAYSTLMLNTDLHSGSVKSKMSLEDFKKNTRRVVSDKVVSNQILEEIFEEISKREILLENRLVEHPLPIGCRRVAPWIKPVRGTFVIPFFMEIADSWSQAIQIILDDLQWWTDELIEEAGIFKNRDDLFDVVLASLETSIQIMSKYKLEKENLLVLENILQSAPFSHGSALHSIAINWLELICERMGSSLGEAWRPIVRILAHKVDFSSPVNSQSSLASTEIHNINFQQFSGQGMVSFLQALFSLRTPNTAFVRHNLLNLCLGPPSLIEKILKATYEGVGTCGRDSLFSLLSQIPALMDGECNDVAFQLMQLVSKSHMPLIFSLGNDAMFDFLRALETFGVLPDVNVAIGTIEVFGNIAQLLYDRNRGVDRKIDDEVFFLKWYHVLSGLGRIALEQSSLETSKLSMETLLGLLNEQGSLYGTGSWKIIWRSIIFSLLEDTQTKDNSLFFYLVKSSIELLRRSEWFDEVYLHLLKILEASCKSINKDGVNEGFLALAELLKLSLAHPNHFTKDIWKESVEAIMRISRVICPSEPLSLPRDDTDSDEANNTETVPDEMTRSPQQLQSHNMTNMSSSTIPFPLLTGESVNILNMEVVLIAKKCIAQIFLLDLINILIEEPSAGNASLILKSRMELREAQSILEILLNSLAFAQEFNDNIVIRRTMVDSGLVDSLENAILSKQETRSQMLAMEMLFQLHYSSISPNKKQVALGFIHNQAAQLFLAEKFNEISLSVLSNYIKMRSSGSDRRPGKSWTELAVTVFAHWTTIYKMIMESHQVGDNVLKIIKDATPKQFDLALELVSFSNDCVTVCNAAKEFVRFSFARLHHSNINNNSEIGNDPHHQ